MVFKKIELYGFKSFADKLEVDFSGGITCIVGPNGCGKSNVSDAVRWVLGEQSSKALRGTNMQDVIFKGTERRKSLSYCEVSLVFDNSAQTFPIDYTEVVLSRKLYRSGESEYYINRNAARLKDITNLLHDSGIDRDGLTIISQGQVAEIINSKPENRRDIFEEAAGIAKFKSRKVDAERRLERTQENIMRVNDVIAEIERTLGPLLKQAETAEKYVKLKEQLKVLEINAYIYQYDASSETKVELQRVLDEISAALSDKQTKYNQVAEQNNSSLDEIAALDKKAEYVREQILSLSLGLERHSGEKKLVQEKLNLLFNQDTDVKAELENLQSQLEHEREHQRISKDLHAALGTERDEVQKQLNEAIEDYYVKLEKLSEAEHASFRNQNEIFIKLSNLTDAKGTVSLLNAQKENLTLKINEVQTHIDDGNANIQKISDNINKTAGKVDNYKWFTGEKTAELERVEKHIAELSENKAELERTLNIAGLDRAQLVARQKTIQNLIENGEGYKFSVRKLIEARNQSDEVAQNIVGVVAQELSVPAELEVAIEVALGAAAQNVITKDEHKAKTLIDLLSREKWGRATFLPITSVKPRLLTADERVNLAPALRTKYSAGNGIVGIAADLISYDDEIEDVVQSLLGRVVVVENLNCAIALARETKYGYKIVTLDGDVIETRGSITGGSKNALNNNLWHTNNLAIIEKEIDEIDEKIDRETRDHDGICESLNEAQEQLTTLKIALEELKLHHAQGEQLLGILKDEYNTRAAEVGDWVSQSLETRKNLDEVNIKLESYSDIDTNVDAQSANEEIHRNRAVHDVVKREVDEAHEHMTGLRVKVAALESELMATENGLQALANTLLLVEKSIADKQAQMHAIGKNIDMTKNMTVSSEEERIYNESVMKLDEAKTELATFDTKKENIRTNLSELETKRTQLGADIAGLQEKFYRAENNLSKVDSDIAAMQERIYEEYGLNYSSCYMFKDEAFVLETALPEIADLKKQIHKLGNVNIDAIEDSKSSKVRYDEYKEQYTDLITAKEDLEKVINDLSVEMEQKFRTDFDKINHNFQFVFKELFNGGNAKLVLTTPDDYLNSGIDIVAEPPGKKLQNITLLSGGEKALTAIAILFAILKLRPMPFCLLDEIEAALDDANVGRFASYLQKFSQTTQFIVITHRKPTMELADNLYGVTMEEKGVSKLVSVKLEGWNDKVS